MAYNLHHIPIHPSGVRKLTLSTSNTHGHVRLSDQSNTPFQKWRNLQTMRLHNHSHIHRGRCYRSPVLPRASGRVTEHQNSAFISRTQSLKPQEALYSAALFHSLWRRQFVMCVWDFFLVLFDTGLIPFLYLLARMKLRRRQRVRESFVHEGAETERHSCYDSSVNPEERLSVPGKKSSKHIRQADIRGEWWKTQ